jgi:hypothetical protein
LSSITNQVSELKENKSGKMFNYSEDDWKLLRTMEKEFDFDLM